MTFAVTYKRYKIYSINEQKAGDPEAYYEEHDKQLDAFHDAQFALEQRNIDVSSITAESIKILQKRLKDTEEEIRLQEEILQQNERDQKLLSEYQKEIDTYLGVKKDEIYGRMMLLLFPKKNTAYGFSATSGVYYVTVSYRTIYPNILLPLP